MHVMAVPSATDRPVRRTAYLVRHAESRYNRAIKNWDLMSVVGERDHGLTATGLAQCRKLHDCIFNADSADAQALRAPNRITLSSPLCRALLTAHLALPCGHQRLEPNPPRGKR